MTSAYYRRQTFRKWSALYIKMNDHVLFYSSFFFISLDRQKNIYMYIHWHCIKVHWDTQTDEDIEYMYMVRRVWVSQKSLQSPCLNYIGKSSWSSYCFVYIYMYAVCFECLNNWSFTRRRCNRFYLELRKKARAREGK